MDMEKNEIEALLLELAQPAYRAGQVYSWLNRGVEPKHMTNLPLSLRTELEKHPFGGCRIYDKFVSKADGTVKYLFELHDGNLVEGVLMHYRYGNTLCISTQVGCRMGCAFCASTLEGCIRNLSSGEMLSFIAAVERDNPSPAPGERFITNIVLMGSGEPLDNYENVMAFLRRCVSPDALKISPRNISLSTCGLVPKIYSLADEALHVTLSVSLHAATDEKRSELMPVNRAYPLEQLIKAAKYYADKTKRRVVFEYALIEGKNSSIEDAKQLAALLRGLLCHVNLIPLNPVKERNLLGISKKNAEVFAKWLNDLHISATVRREMGADIDGACGQLRRRVLNELRNEN